MKTFPSQKVRECVANRCSQSPNWAGDGMGQGMGVVREKKNDSRQKQGNRKISDKL